MALLTEGLVIRRLTQWPRYEKLWVFTRQIFGCEKLKSVPRGGAMMPE